MNPKGRNPVPYIGRFEGRTNKNGPIHPYKPELGPCWLWKGAPNSSGYGILNGTPVAKNTAMAHRVSWFIRYGKIPAKMLVLHSCDRRLCVNPEHLFLGNDTENMRDRTDKGRSAKGEDYPQSKLTEKTVLEIRASYYKGDGRFLARKYGVSPCTIMKVVNGESWKHLLASPPAPAESRTGPRSSGKEEPATPARNLPACSPSASESAPPSPAPLVYQDVNTPNPSYANKIVNESSAPAPVESKPKDGSV